MKRSWMDLRDVKRWTLQKFGSKWAWRDEEREGVQNQFVLSSTDI